MTKKTGIDPWGFDREQWTWWQRNMHWVIPVGAAVIIWAPVVIAAFFTSPM